MPSFSMPSFGWGSSKKSVKKPSLGAPQLNASASIPDVDLTVPDMKGKVPDFNAAAAAAEDPDAPKLDANLKPSIIDYSGSGPFTEIEIEAGARSVSVLSVIVCYLFFICLLYELSLVLLLFRHLPKMDWFSKSDPIIAAFVKNPKGKFDYKAQTEWEL